MALSNGKTPANWEERLRPQGRSGLSWLRGYLAGFQLWSSQKMTKFCYSQVLI